MAGRVTQAWQWWIDGLVDAVLLLEARVRRDRPLRLAPVEGGYVVVHAAGRRGRRVLTPGPEGLAPARLAARLKGRVVEVAVRPEAMVSGRLGPYPAESRAYVDGIVAHRLERMTPWPAADTLLHRRVDPVAPDDPRLMVTIEATSRALHADMLAGCARGGAKDVRLVRPGEDGTADVVLPIASTETRDERRRVALTLRLALAAIAFLTIFGLWAFLEASDENDARLAEIEERIADFRRRLSPVTEAGASDRDLVAALSRETPMAVIALENLSEAMPDDTHLTALRIARGKLTMSGITRDIAALTSALETTQTFVEPTFSAPTVRLERGDRFTLDLQVAGSEGSKR